MNPYAYAIEALEERASISEANAPIHEADGNHAQGALARMTAASCRAAIALLQGGQPGTTPPLEPAKPKPYTWRDVKGYTSTSSGLNLADDTERLFLTMKDGQQFKVDVPRMNSEEETRDAAMRLVNEQAGRAA